MTTAEAAIIDSAIRAAREGTMPSVTHLMSAHQLATRYKMPGVAAELRGHIREAIPDPQRYQRIGYDIVIGLCSGILGGFIMNWANARRARKASRTTIIHTHPSLRHDREDTR